MAGHQSGRALVAVVAAVLSGLIFAGDAPAALAAPRSFAQAPAVMLTKPPVPASGAYLGSSAGPNPGESRDAAIARTEAAFGRPLDINHQFYRWNQNLIGPVQQDDAAAGRYPFVSWKPQRTNGQVVSWASIAAGREDATIRAQARAARDFGHPMFAVFHHEPYDESRSGAWGAPAEFRAAYRHVVDLFRQEGANNVAWVMVLTAWDYAQGRGDSFYPGNDVIDWIAADPYNWHQRDGRWISLATAAQGFYDWGSRTGKPLMLAEWGSTEDPRDPHRKAAWYDDAAATLRNWPNIRAAVYFNNLHDGYDWRVDTSAASLAAFRRLASDAHFNPATPNRLGRLVCGVLQRFDDVPAGHVFAPAIACAAEYGLLDRASGGRFEPDRAVTRGELASFVARALDAAGARPVAGVENYSDIAGDPRANDIRRLAAVGVLRGYPDGTFRPSTLVSRAQIASILVRAHDVAGRAPLAAPSVRAFRDITGDVHADAIDRAGLAGLVTGTSVGTFTPSQSATRGQVVAIATRLLNLFASEGVAVAAA